jgi:hypothetical protein
MAQICIPHRVARLRSLGLAALAGFALAPSASLAFEGPAGPGRCGGTLLQLQVEQSGSAAFDRFRFDLGLEAEAPSKAGAMALLNSRLVDLRTALQPLVSGDLTIPAPTTYRTGVAPAWVPPRCVSTPVPRWAVWCARPTTTP